MSTAPSHRPAAEVEQALFDLNDGTHPFEVLRNGQRIEAVWRHGARGPGVVFGSVEWRYRVTLLGESGEYTDSVFAKNFDDDNTFFTFRSTDVSRPVQAVLAACGWTHRPNPFSRFFRRLVGR